MDRDKGQSTGEQSTDMSEAARALGALGASKGGRARAEKLTPEQRSEIARRAVEARWARQGKEPPPQATHAGVLKIGNTEIQCYVLDNGCRIISTRGMMKALGRTWRGRKYAGTELPVFLEAKNLKPFIGDGLSAVLSLVEFRTPTGARAEGFHAALLPKICEIYLSARDADALTGPQERIAKQAEILMRGLAHVGIIALVDEATGYQVDRDKQELRRILEAYISGELLAWAERFPKEFYQELFRLRGWQFDPMSVKRPRMVGKLTKALVYKKLPPGVLEELERKNPPVYEKDYRRYKHHQYLTPDIGNVHLEKQVASVTTLMRISKDWQMFERHFNKAFPPRERQGSFLPEESDEGDD